jgi:hypothetical protein
MGVTHVLPRHLLVGGVAALAIAVGLSVRSIGPAAERSVGVMRGPGGVEIRYLLCEGERLHFVRLLDYGLAYGSGYVGPVVWQLRSDRGAHIERVTVGRVPDGFEEEVDRLPLPSPSKLTVVTDPYGEDAMSFRLGDLRRNRVYRADYIYLPLPRFRSTKDAYCAERRRAHRFRLASYPFFAAAGLALTAALVRRVRGQRRVINALRGTRGRSR